ncbi:MAG TPA: FAD-dependent oxidoreductase [Pseudonocardiaceae bacterium]|nr:FAD-dependent oxidoreductase [Pseudonocardiaceae bacterium]
MTSPRIAVIGAGIVGSAVARALALRGAAVWLLDRDDRAEATTRISFAWVNAHRKREPHYHALNVAGMAEHHTLAARLDPHRRWHFPTGHLEFATDPEHAARIEADLRELHALDYPGQRVSREWARAREPWVRIPDDAETIAFFPSEGFVLPVVLNDALIDHAQALGAHVDLRAEVLDIAEGASHLTLRCRDRPALEVDQVVICAGRWTERLADGLGLPVPLVAADEPASAATAFQARTAPLPIEVNGVITTSVGNLRPEAGGRLVFQAHDLDTEANPDTVPPAHVTEELRRRLAGILRVDVAAVRASVGRRVLPVDGLTIAGHLDARRAVYAVATHSGVTLGPLLGRLVAEELIDGRSSPLLATFGPERFRDRTEHVPARKLLVQGGD